jgi:hypothetical protein
VAFKIRTTSAFKFNTAGLGAALPCMRGLIAAACSVVHGSSSWRYKSAKKSLILTKDR